MKKVSLENVLETIKNPTEEVILPDEIMQTANKPLERMLELAK
jgi:quinolinate synthase